MTVHGGSRQILIHGMVLVLVGLVWGLAVPATPHPRLALGTHIQPVTNGMLFIFPATAMLTLPHGVGLRSVWVVVVAVWLTWAMAMSEVSNSWWGTTQTLPIAASQAGTKGGEPWQEFVVTLVHIAAGLGLIIAGAFLVGGFSEARIGHRDQIMGKAAKRGRLPAHLVDRQAGLGLLQDQGDLRLGEWWLSSQCLLVSNRPIAAAENPQKLVYEAL